MKRTDFRPNDSSSSKLSDKDRKIIKKKTNSLYVGEDARYEDYSEQKKDESTELNKNNKWSRIAGGYEVNEKTGEVRATTKYGKFGKIQRDSLKISIRKS